MNEMDKIKQNLLKTIKVKQSQIFECDINSEEYTTLLNELEVLNDFNDTPSVADIQKELNQFEGFEITQEELEVTSLSKQENFNDLDSVLNN